MYVYMLFEYGRRSIYTLSGVGGASGKALMQCKLPSINVKCN